MHAAAVPDAAAGPQRPSASASKRGSPAAVSGRVWQPDGVSGGRGRGRGRGQRWTWPWTWTGSAVDVDGDGVSRGRAIRRGKRFAAGPLTCLATWPKRPIESQRRCRHSCISGDIAPGVTCREQAAKHAGKLLRIWYNSVFHTVCMRLSVWRLSAMSARGAAIAAPRMSASACWAQSHVFCCTCDSVDCFYG